MTRHCSCGGTSSTGPGCTTNRQSHTHTLTLTHSLTHSLTATRITSTHTQTHALIYNARRCAGSERSDTHTYTQPQMCERGVNQRRIPHGRGVRSLATTRHCSCGGTGSTGPGCTAYRQSYTHAHTHTHTHILTHTHTHAPAHAQTDRRKALIHAYTHNHRCARREQSKGEYPAGAGVGLWQRRGAAAAAEPAAQG